MIAGDFVTTEDGTGIVHIAPTFGADDNRVAQENGIPPMLVKDENDNLVPLVDLTGRFLKGEKKLYYIYYFPNCSHLGVHNTDTPIHGLKLRVDPFIKETP